MTPEQLFDLAIKLERQAKELRYQSDKLYELVKKNHPKEYKKLMGDLIPF